MSRRTMMAAIASLALAAMPLATVQAAATAHAAATSTWTQSGADAAMSNRNQGETGLTSTTVVGLASKYGLSKVPRYGACGGADFGGDVPVFDGTLLYWFDGSRVRASNLRSGASTWKSPVLDSFGDTFVRQIAVSGGRVFVIASNCTRVSQPEGGLIAYSATTGTILWQTSLSTEPNPISIAVAGQRLLVSGYDGDESAATWSYNVADGTVDWQNTQCAQQSPTAIFTVGGVIPDNICQNPTTRELSSAGLSLSTGAPTWMKDYGYNYWRGDSSAVSSPNAYLTDKTGHIVAMSPSGVRVWRSSTAAGKVVAAGPSSVFTDCGTTDSICALNRTTGVRRWIAKVGDNSAGVALAADVVYPYLLNAATGAALSANNVSPSGRSAVAAGHLWTENGRVLNVYGLP